MAKAPTAGRAGGLLLLAVGLASQLGPGLCEICECSADACTKDTLHFMTSVYINNECFRFCSILYSTHLAWLGLAS